MQLTGSFQYASAARLERALAEARDHLADDDIDLWQAVRRRGMALVIDGVLPDDADRQTTAAVLAALAEAAVEGHVDVTLGSRLVDAFVSGDDIA